MFQSDERTEAGQLADLAGNEIADFVELVDVAPWIFAELLDANGNALVRLVDFEHNCFDVVAFFEDFGRMVDLARPGNIRDVDHAVQTFFQLDEGTVAGEVADFAFDLGAGW